jgi:hypothetical protein
MKKLSSNMIKALLCALEYDGDLTPGVVRNDTASALLSRKLIEYGYPGYGWRQTWQLTEEGRCVANSLRQDK